MTHKNLLSLSAFDRACEEEAIQRKYCCFQEWHIKGKDTEAFQWAIAKEKELRNAPVLKYE